jgi:hypothetical protein
MNEIRSLTRPNQDKDMPTETQTSSDALRRAEAFPVKGGEILPAQRKIWFKTVQLRQRPETETA